MNDIFDQLETLIEQRLQQAAKDSYVGQLKHKGLDSILKKIGEEASEVVIAAKGDSYQGDKEAIIYESCDLIFHLMVLLGYKGIKLTQIRLELQHRFGVSGLAEKANRREN